MDLAYRKNTNILHILHTAFDIIAAFYVAYMVHIKSAQYAKYEQLLCRFNILLAYGTQFFFYRHILHIFIYQELN